MEVSRPGAVYSGIYIAVISSYLYRHRSTGLWTVTMRKVKVTLVPLGWCSGEAIPDTAHIQDWYDMDAVTKPNTCWRECITTRQKCIYSGLPSSSALVVKLPWALTAMLVFLKICIWFKHIHKNLGANYFLSFFFELLHILVCVLSLFLH